MKGVEKPSLRRLLETLEEARHGFDCGHPFWGRRLPQPDRWLGRCSERHARHAVQGGNPVRHPSGLPPGAVQDHDRLREKRGAFGDDRVPPGLDPVAVKLRREQEPGVTPERGVVERSTPRAVVKNPAARDGCRRQPGRVRRFTGFTDMANDEKLETRPDDRHLGTQTEPPQPATLTHCAIAACDTQTIYVTNTSPPTDFILFKEVNSRDVRMVQTGQNFGFAFKPGEPIRIVREGLGQDLQCHVPVELGVSGAIHLPHAAFADLGGDTVWAEGGAGGQRHNQFVGLLHAVEVNGDPYGSDSMD